MADWKKELKKEVYWESEELEHQPYDIDLDVGITEKGWKIIHKQIEETQKKSWLNGYNSALDNLSVYMINILQDLKKKEDKNDR